MRRTSEDVFELPPSEEPWGAGLDVEAVVALLEPLVYAARKERLLSVLSERLVSVTAVLDAPHDPYNGGAVLRSCDAFGVQQIHVVPRDEPFLLSHRVTRGTERWVDVVVHASPAEAVAALRRRGYTLVSTHPQGTLTPEELARIPRLALLLGNEHAGVREELASQADATVRVPMRGFVESLNVSVTAGILLSAAVQGRPGDLSAAEVRRLYARGLFRSVSRAGEVLEAARERAHGR